MGGHLSTEGGRYTSGGESVQISLEQTYILSQALGLYQVSVSSI